MMPQGTGSISTPGEFLWTTFWKPIFRGHPLISPKKSLVKKSKFRYRSRDLLYHQEVAYPSRCAQRSSIWTFLNIRNWDFMRVELSQFPSENMKISPKSGWGLFQPSYYFFQKPVCCFFRKTTLKQWLYSMFFIQDPNFLRANFINWGGINWRWGLYWDH